MRLVSFRPTRSSPTPPAGSRSIFGTTAIAALVGLVIVAAPTPGAALDAAETARPKAAIGASGDHALDFFFAALAAARDDASAARARERIEAHWRRSGSATADLLSTRAVLALHGGDAALALDLLDAAIVVAPRWAEARLHRAMVHLSRHDIDRAVDDLSATLELEPRHLAAMSALAAILETGDRKAEALAWLRRLARLDPRNPALGAERMERLTTDVEGREL
jgi:tetratricopeptide (TPR) repeat protein